MKAEGKFFLKFILLTASSAPWPLELVKKSINKIRINSYILCLTRKIWINLVILVFQLLSKIGKFFFPSLRFVLVPRNPKNPKENLKKFELKCIKVQKWFWTKVTGSGTFGLSTCTLNLETERLIKEIFLRWFLKLTDLSRTAYLGSRLSIDVRKRHFSIIFILKIIRPTHFCFLVRLSACTNILTYIQKIKASIKVYRRLIMK